MISSLLHYDLFIFLHLIIVHEKSYVYFTTPSLGQVAKYTGEKLRE